MEQLWCLQIRRLHVVRLPPSWVWGDSGILMWTGGDDPAVSWAEEKGGVWTSDEDTFARAVDELPYVCESWAVDRVFLSRAEARMFAVVHRYRADMFRVVAVSSGGALVGKLADIRRGMYLAGETEN